MHTRAQTHARTDTRVHRHTRAQTHACTDTRGTDTRGHRHTRAQTHARTDTRVHRQVHRHTRAQTHARTDTRAHRHTRAQTHARTRHTHAQTGAQTHTQPNRTFTTPHKGRNQCNAQKCKCFIYRASPSGPAGEIAHGFQRPGPVTAGSPGSREDVTGSRGHGFTQRSDRRRLASRKG